MIGHPEKPSRQFLPVLAAAFLGAITAATPAVILTMRNVEEPWNIVVVYQGLGFAELACAIALAHALILGLPGFLILRSRGYTGIAACGSAGFLVGAAPSGALGLLAMLATQDASSGGEPTVVNHVPTLAGLVEYALAIGYVGLLGLVGGVTFGIVIWWCAGRSEPADRDQGARRTLAWRLRVVVSIAIVLTVAVFGLPQVFRDTSCHNLFRDGRTMAVPQIGVDMKLTADDWAKLRQIAVEFAGTNRLAFRGDEVVRDGQLMWRNMDLCNEAGMTIVVTDRP